jgi:hypothetical protein
VVVASALEARAVLITISTACLLPEFLSTQQREKERRPKPTPFVVE